MSAKGVSLFAPVGPVAEAFVHDQRLITAIMGPYGSAKTTSAMRKMVQSAFWQNPGPDGVRRVRWCVVRDTYAQLETNVLNSWFTWFPKTKDNWNGREMRHRLRFEVAFLDGADPVVIELDIYFRAMGDQKAEDVLKGLELTGLWLNEVDTLDKGVLRFGLPRCGRYPPAKDGGCQWYGVIADFNAPDADNWTYELLVNEELPIEGDALDSLREKVGERFGIGFHRQPGGREPEAENLANLPPGYYDSMIIGMTDADIARFVDNKFGAVRSGQPVYPEYNDEIHAAKEALRPMPGVPVCMAIDGGSTPAVLFGDRVDGRSRWLGEVVVFKPGKDDVLDQLDPEEFGVIVGHYWLDNFSRANFGGAWGDPAIWYGASADDELSWINLFWNAFRKAVGAVARSWKIKPAPVAGNRLPERLAAVRNGLKKMTGGKPALTISPACKTARRGFNNGYVILRTQLSNGQGRWQEKPLKNDFSHVHDAGQYLELGMQKRGALADDGGVVRSRDARAQSGAARVNYGGSAFAPRQSAGRR